MIKMNEEVSHSGIGGSDSPTRFKQHKASPKQRKKQSSTNLIDKIKNVWFGGDQQDFEGDRKGRCLGYLMVKD